AEVCLEDCVSMPFEEDPADKRRLRSRAPAVVSSTVRSSALVAAVALLLGASCGHTSKTLDAFENSRSSGAGGAGSGSGGADAGAHVCAPADPSLPQFACGQVASQQFDPISMQAYCVPEDVEEEVDRILKAMGPAEKATQMLGVPIGNKNYRDIERSPDVDVPGIGTVRGYRYRDASRGVNLDAGQDNRP